LSIYITWQLLKTIPFLEKLDQKKLSL